MGTWKSWRPWRRTQRVVVWFPAVVGTVAAVVLWVQQKLAQANDLDSSARFVGGVVVAGVVLVVAIGVAILYLHFKREANPAQDAPRASAGALAVGALVDLHRQSSNEARENAETVRKLRDESSVLRRVGETLVQTVASKDATLAKYNKIVGEWSQMYDKSDKQLRETTDTIDAIHNALSGPPSAIHIAMGSTESHPSTRIASALGIYYEYMGRRFPDFGISLADVFEQMGEKGRPRLGLATAEDEAESEPPDFDSEEPPPPEAAS
jgi:hypothetical protein